MLTQNSLNVLLYERLLKRSHFLYPVILTFIEGTAMSMNYNRKLFSNFISLSIVQGINFLIPLLVMPYVISKVGAEGFGIIAVAQVAMIYLSTIADYGFNISATREIALYKADNDKMSAIFFTVLYSKLFITAVLLVVLLTVLFCIPGQQHFTLYIMGFTYVIGQALLPVWFFQGIEKMYHITIYSLLSRLIFLVLVFLFIQKRGDEMFFLLFLGIGNIIAGSISVFIAITRYRLTLQLPSFSDIRREIKKGWQLTVSNLSINTFLYSGIFILRIFTSDLIVGYYGIAERIFFAVRQVLSIFSQVIYPQLCQFILKPKEEAQHFFRKVYLPFLLAVIAGCGILFVLSPQIIHVFIKDGSTLPVQLLRLLSFVPVIVCLNIPAYQLLLAFDRKKSYMRIYTTATIVNIIINVILANSLGATGTVTTIMITELFITAGLNLELNKNGLFGYIRPGTI